MIPVVDIFAGPGGLGEGFSSSVNGQGQRRFKLVVSIEKDPRAHETLRLRAFRRAFREAPPQGYYRYVKGEWDWERIRSHHPEQALAADREARCIELSPEAVAPVRALVQAAVPKNRPWVLIGGPPCQAYSLVGRARNKGVDGYRPELDKRQTLYVEYLQLLADHAPPVFVMENVKGLLSAQLQSQHLFDRMREDLSNPSAALRRENRPTVGSRQRYTIHALMPASDLFRPDPNDYVVRAELLGVPQRRHRVILLGVREDVRSRPSPLLAESTLRTVREAIDDLPRLRSGLSKEDDSDDIWYRHLTAMRRMPWVNQIDSLVKSQIESCISAATRPAAARGAELLQSRGRLVFNHSSRGHIRADLQRYMFASAFATVNKVSPVLSDFPTSLLPDHENVSRALGTGLFADRFRVQVAGHPSTTITSHISKDGHYYIHFDSTQCRSLTVREAARLQTFPDDYFFCGPRTSQFHQVGNAVPPKLAEQIADSVAQLLSE